MERSVIRNQLESSQHLKTIDVDTGEVRVSSEPVMVQSIALGSCVAVVVYDRNRKIGGIAHIMLPGKAQTIERQTRYAENAIDGLLERTRELGAEIGNLEIHIVGGANILQEGDIPDKVIKSVIDYLKELHLELKGMRVGGIVRRSVFLNTITGSVFYTEGNSTSMIMLKDIERN